MMTIMVDYKTDEDLNNLIKGHGGGADGHSISSSLGVGSFAPVSLLVNMVITMRRRWRRRRRGGEGW